jgi:hypothetical protein
VLFFFYPPCGAGPHPPPTTASLFKFDLLELL